MSPDTRRGRLLRRRGQQIPAFARMAVEIERFLDSRDFDLAIPTLEPSLEEARTAAGRLKAHLADLELIVKQEHGDDRR